MRIDILTLFPEMFAPLKASVIGRAVDSKAIEIVVTDIRDYSKDKHCKCDDTPYGGGSGMVMMVQPIFDAVNAVDPNHDALRLFASPRGKTFDNTLAREFSAEKRLLILCGHYEGVDERAIELCIDKQVSLGDFILTGGEIAAMAIVDATVRFVDGVLGSSESPKDESFSDSLSGMLEYPQYTRPREFNGKKVPQVLFEGNHAAISNWRKEQSEKITRALRPDLLDNKNN